VRYDEYVKRPNEEHEYTEEQIREVVKCKTDLMYFIRNYIYIVHQDSGVQLFDPYDYQIDLLEKFQNHRFNVCLLSRQSGKCLEGDTVIKLRNKTTGEIKEITMENFFNQT
jgi:hypothetical protein